MKVEEQTFVQPQTKKIHLVHVSIGTLHNCHCSFRREHEPETREVHLKEDRVCRTCAQVYCKRNDIDYDEIDAPESREQIEA